MEVATGKRQNNQIIVSEDSIKTANGALTRILLESFITIYLRRKRGGVAALRYASAACLPPLQNRSLQLGLIARPS
jgi:hypothetical protein